MTKKVLLSTDIGSDLDDALALLTIINTGIDLEGVYTVNGEVKSRAYIAKHMIDLCNKKVDVCVGESEPIGGNIKPHSYFEECYIDDKFVDEKKSSCDREIIHRSVEEVGIKPRGLEDLAGKLSKVSYDLLNIAPMTNLARLIELYPQVIKNINELYIMGCNLSEPEELEHNVRFDIPSAVKVFNSCIPITVIPPNLCRKYRLPADQLKNLQTPVGLYVKHMAEGFLGTHTASEFLSKDLSSLIKSIREINPHEKESKRGLKTLKKEKLLVNLDDPYYAAFSPEDYLKQYHGLIQHLGDTAFNYSQNKGNILGKCMAMIIPKDVSIADVYVPYCYLNPGKVKVEKADIQITDGGLSKKKKGEKHKIVTDIDFSDFKRFLDEYLK